MHRKRTNKKSPEHESDWVGPSYSQRALNNPIPKNHFPKDGISSNCAYQLIHDELMLDGQSKLNLATFVTTWMEPEAEKLMMETFDKNMIDKDEYPQTAEIEARCANMLLDLYHAEHDGVGVSTVGSSEAVMLAGLAFKWNWRKRMEAKGKSTDKPNLILGSNVQVVWEKFCRYWDVEPIYLPLEEDRYVITPDQVIENINENTIGVVAILGTTFTGENEPIKEIHDAIVNYNEENNDDVPLHIDAASGGFVAPFLHPDLEWDFRLKQVKSINASGHKYGLVYPGVGWVVWRSESELPEDLIFHVNYLGGDMPTFTLNFSRPGNQVVAQYYNFIRLGFKGYKEIMQSLSETTMYISKEVESMGPFKLLSDGSTMPVFAFAMKDDSQYTVFDVSDHMRQYGWQVPAYTMPDNINNLAVLRVVIREGFSRDMANMLLDNLKATVEYLETRSKKDHGDRKGKLKC